MVMSIKVDVVLDLAMGDCGKGKVSHDLLRRGGYTHSLRFNGGGNAGHTIFHHGKKFVTHQVPAGVFWGLPSVIGPGCVVNATKLFDEVDYLEANGVPVKGLIKVASNAHLITYGHLNLDSLDVRVGTTKTGNGPCYTDKYARVGQRVSDKAAFFELNGVKVIDMFEEFYTREDDVVILAEGAQGFYLDIDWGDYPFVTSSHCGIGSVLLNGFTHKQIRKVYGVVKAYETYVGAKKFEPAGNPTFERIREVGQEYGATTGRPRQVNWLNFNNLVKAARMNSIDELIINKLDILDQVQEWAFYEGEKLLKFTNSDQFSDCLKLGISEKYPCKITFSRNPHAI